MGGYPSGYGENDFTWSPVPYVTVSETYKNYGFPTSTGNRWTTKLEAIYFNGVRLIDSQLQPTPGSNYALIDTGNPIMNLASDVLAQITNAWASNPDVSIKRYSSLPRRHSSDADGGCCSFAMENGTD